MNEYGHRNRLINDRTSGRQTTNRILTATTAAAHPEQDSKATRSQWTTVR
ncbi:MAG: hypothetical protein Q8J97_00400 [Flavobacteriaceae bacterium]|nr:hypothetical protein [Flavobacteriaceae bacterium]